MDCNCSSGPTHRLPSSHSVSEHIIRSTVAVDAAQIPVGGSRVEDPQGSYAVTVPVTWNGGPTRRAELQGGEVGRALRVGVALIPGPRVGIDDADSGQAIAVPVAHHR